jgi:hypothetical protein
VSIRSALESLYEDTCNVYESREYIKENGSTGHREELVTADIPCRISYKSINAGTETDKADYKEQLVKLFIAPEISIKPGSRVEVTRNGSTTMYKASGEPAIYYGHKEIVLELWEVRA